MDSNVVLKLTEIDGAGNSTSLSTISASSSTITIGRSNEADIYFGEDDQTVSRRQFEVSFSGGAPTLKNTGRNPVLYKNGKKQLASGAQINIDSDVEFSFRGSKLRLTVEVPAVYCLKTTGAGGRAAFKVESDRKYTVGRSPDCDITLDSAGVSRRHCKIEIGAAEILTVHDLGSVNGVRLIIKGEVQEESSDIEVPCGDKFIIGDIECILGKDGRGQDSGKKKKVLLPVAIVIFLLIAAVTYFVLKSTGPDKPVPKPTETEEPAKHTVTNEPLPTPNKLPGATAPEPQESSKKTARQIELERKEKIAQEKQKEAAKELEQNAAKVRSIIESDQSYALKAEAFNSLAKEKDSKDVMPVCEQLAGYYAQCSLVEQLANSMSKEYAQRKEEARSSIEQMRFDFDTSLSFKKLESDISQLKASHKTVANLMQKADIEEPEFPDELIDNADLLVEMAYEYGEKARSLFYIWTDLENSSFASSKFDKEEMITSIDTLYPDEDMGTDICAKIEEIVNYQEQMLRAYQLFIVQVGNVLSNYTENGVSEALEPSLVVLKSLREIVEMPLPGFFEEPPLITDVLNGLYDRLNAISGKWSNLEFLTYCGDWKEQLEQKESEFDEIDEVLQLVNRLCVGASLRCAVDVEKGTEPYRQIKNKLESGKELDLNDYNKLIRVYGICHEYLQHTLFCELQKASKKEMEAVSANCLNFLYERLKMACDDGSIALNPAEKNKCVQNAKMVLETLDSAVTLPPEFISRIREYRLWVEAEVQKLMEE